MTSTSTAARTADTPTSPDLTRDQQEPDQGPEIDPDPSTVRSSLRVLDSLDRLSTAELRVLEDWSQMATDFNNFSPQIFRHTHTHKTENKNALFLRT